MKKIITLLLLVLSICITTSIWAMEPQRSTQAKKSETQTLPASTSSNSKLTTTHQETTTKKSTTRLATTRRQTAATEAEVVTTSTPISTESSTTASTSANNSVLFGKNKMLSIAAWTLIGIGVLFVVIVVLGGKSRRNRRPFQKNTKRYKNRSKYNNYSSRYRSNIKRK